VITEEYLRAAIETVAGPRASDYGDMTASFSRIAAIWSAILGTEVSPRQVALCMAGLKLSRAAPIHHKDSYIDGAAYFAIAGELGDRDD